MKEEYIESFIIGLFIGVIVYSIYAGTFGFSVLWPLVIAFIALKAAKKAMDKKKSRNDD